MYESACLSDLRLYELDRFHWLEANQGNISGFKTEHGKVLAEHGGSLEALKAHQVIPGLINALLMDGDNRQALALSLNAYKPATTFVSPEVIEQARQYVTELYGCPLAGVRVFTVGETVMPSTSLGVVYSNAADAHVIVVPRWSFDPYGLMVRQFATAAHYSLMRVKAGLAAMMSDDLTQAMVAQYALLRFATDEPAKCAVMRHMQMMVGWEFAKGLSRTPEFPLGFLASELGSQLMLAYGPGMFKALLTEQYESASHGRAMWFGSCNFTGTALALALLEDDAGMARFMAIDTGDRKLADKLMEAFPSLAGDGFKAMQPSFNTRLAGIIAKADSKPGPQGTASL